MQQFFIKNIRIFGIFYAFYLILDMVLKLNILQILVQNAYENIQINLRFFVPSIVN